MTCDLRCSLGQVFIADKVVQIWQLFKRAGENSGVLEYFGRNCGCDLWIYGHQQNGEIDIWLCKVNSIFVYFK